MPRVNLESLARSWRIPWYLDVLRGFRDSPIFVLRVGTSRKREKSRFSDGSYRLKRDASTLPGRS